MHLDWTEEVTKFRLTGRENDRVRVDAPAGSMAAPYNGQDGYIAEFRADWIIASINGTELRFRPDELKLL